MADIVFIQIEVENLRNGTDIIQTSGREVIGVGAGRYVCDALATAELFAAHPLFVGRSSNGRYFRALPEAGRIPVALAGVRGNEAFDDGNEIRAAFAYAEAIGADGVRFDRATYRFEATPPGATSIIGGPQLTLVLPVRKGVHDFGHATFVRQSSGRSLLHYPTGIVDMPLLEDVAVGARQVRISSAHAAQLQIGEMVLWQLSELPYDTPEALEWDYARVVAVNGEYVTLDKPILRAVVLSAITGENKRLRKLPLLEDCTISNVTFGSVGCENAIQIFCGQNITIENVGATNIGAGSIVAGYVDGLTIKDCWAENSLLTQASFGPAFSFAECRGVVMIRPTARGTTRLIRAEAGAEVTVIGGRFDNTLVDSSGKALGTTVAVIEALGQGKVSVHDSTVTGHGGYRLAEVNNGQPDYPGTVQFTGILRMVHPDMPWSIPVDRINGILDMDNGGVREVHDFTRLRRWKRRFQLKDNEYLYAYGPPGILVRANFYVSPGLTTGPGQQMTGLWLGREGDNGWNVAVPPYGPLATGSEVAIPVFGGKVGGQMWTLRNNRMQLLCVTAANAGLNTAGRFVDFEGWIATRKGDVYAASESDWLASSGLDTSREALFAAYDLPAVAGGATATVDLAVPGMLATDYIDSVRVTGGLNGLALQSVEALAGVARLQLYNPTASTIDCPAANLAVRYCRESIGK